jgi:hypothetical protein
MLKRLPATRSRVVVQMLDAALTLRGQAPVSGAAALPVAQGGTRGYRKMHLLLERVRRFQPAMFEQVRKALWDNQKAPMRCEDIRVLGFGSGETAFLVDEVRGNRRSMVLKVHRRTLGRPANELVEHARMRRTKFEVLCSRFDFSPVILPTSFFVMHGPLLGYAASASLQPYVEQYTDLFEWRAEALVRLLSEQPCLLAEFTHFVGRSMRFAEQEGWCVDMLGQNNLVLAGSGEGVRLTLLDVTGIVNFEHKRLSAPASLAVLMDRLSYLADVAAQASQ